MTVHSGLVTGMINCENLYFRLLSALSQNNAQGPVTLTARISRRLEAQHCMS